MWDALAFVMRRASRYWQVLAILSLGAVLATALLASAPLLVNTVVEFGMRRTLLDADPPDANLRLILRTDPDLSHYRTLHVSVQNMAAGYVGTQLEQVVPVGNSRWMYPWIDEELRPNRRVSFCFYDRTYGEGNDGLYAHADLVQGYWPTDTSQPFQAFVPGIVGEAMADAYGLGIGDELGLSFRENAEAPDLWLKIAGIIRASDPYDRYWFGSFSPLQSQHSAHYESQYSVLVSPEAFFDLSTGLLGPSQVELSWHVMLNPSAIALDDIPRIRAALHALEENITQVHEKLRVESALDGTLEAFSRQAGAIRAPLYFLSATVMVLALYYVTMDATLSLRQFRHEFAVLRSRGASGWQLFRIQLLEAALVAVVAILSGPGLALSLVRILAVLGPLADIRQADWVLWLPPASWMAAVAGAVACMASLLLPVPNALQHSIVTHQQSLSRANRPPWWQRYYVDVFLLLAGLILIWRLRIYGTILGGTPTRPQVDWLLLLSPLALLLGSAAILLRVFPALLNLAAHLVSRSRGLPTTLALWQIARDPTHIARLVLLLTLAMALGLFSTGLNAALDRNEDDQSRYTVGSDVRVSNAPPGLKDRLAIAAGVQAVTEARREQGTIALQRDGSYPAFGLLAVDPDTFSQAARFRDDFADRAVTELLERLNGRPSQHVLLPLSGESGGLGLWLWLPEQSREIARRISIEAKLQTYDGQFTNLRLRYDKGRSRPEDGWFYVQGSFPSEIRPVALHSLWFRNPVSSWASRIDRLILGDLEMVHTESSSGTILPWASESGWHVYGRTATVTDDRESMDIDGGRLQIGFENDEMRTGVWYGLQLQSDSSVDPLPALASPAFLYASQASVGDRIGTWIDSEPIDLQIVGRVDYFPTMYEERAGGFAVTALAPLLLHQNRISPEPIYANQVFVATESGTDAREIAGLSADRQVWDAETVRKAIKADPLALGLRSVTLFGYVLTTILSLAGFGTHFYMSTRQHGRTYVILRALGLSPRQLYGLLLFEQALLILAGLALGTVLGLLLNRLTLPGLPLSLGGRPPVPPFLAETDWEAVGSIYLTLAIAFLASLGLATTLLWRVKLHRLLRVDEE